MLKDPLKSILANTRAIWDVTTTRSSVRKNFTKVLQCKTAALGSEIFASSTESKLVHHTCKSRACPSCGYRGTVLWQREQWAALPDIPYTGITFTMPAVFWKIFQQNRRLLKDLPVLGAGVIVQWAKVEHQCKVPVMVIAHTFGRHLTFNAHLHILVSSGGLNDGAGFWVKKLSFDKSIIMQQWRFAVITYLRMAHASGLLRTERSPSQMKLLLDLQEECWWSTDFQPFNSRKHFLEYAGRYVRRPPIAQYRFVEASTERVRFRTNDHRLKREVVTSYSPKEFVELLAEHVHDHYAHSVRYFGLLAPKSKGRLFAGVFALVGQSARAKPQRLSWALSIKRDFQVDPLLDRQGERMRWAGRIDANSKKLYAPENAFRVLTASRN